VIGIKFYTAPIWDHEFPRRKNSALLGYL